MASVRLWLIVWQEYPQVEVLGLLIACFDSYSPDHCLVLYGTSLHDRQVDYFCHLVFPFHDVSE